jgi:glycosyltransferase involved in cell wall biosynthesis
MPMISIVVPCYNEQEVILFTIDRLRTLVQGQPACTFELIFVDDGSSDHTLKLLRASARDNDMIRVIAFSRNFGHQIAVTAGIDAAMGDAIVLIDADLQDPPEAIPEMIKLWQDGYDVVYGTRARRDGESAFKIKTAQGFYRVLNRLSEVPIPLDAGDFRLMGRNVVNVLKDMPERHRFVRGMVAWAGFNQIAMPYERAKRFAGTSKYPLRKMLRFAMDGILAFSSKPLRLSTNIGMIASGLALIGIVYVLFLRLFTSTWVEGWTALMITVLFMGGVQLISLGVIGEYLARAYNEAKARPLYVVRERIGYDTIPQSGQHAAVPLEPQNTR